LLKAVAAEELKDVLVQWMAQQDPRPVEVLHLDGKVVKNAQPAPACAKAQTVENEIPMGLCSSQDGKNWNSHSSGTRRALFGVAYGNGRYVAAGKEGTILVSQPILRLEPGRSLPDGNTQYTLTGPAGRNCHIQVSSNLVVVRGAEAAKSFGLQERTTRNRTSTLLGYFVSAKLPASNMAAISCEFLILLGLIPAGLLAAETGIVSRMSFDGKSWKLDAENSRRFEKEGLVTGAVWSDLDDSSGKVVPGQ
jgi:hypothetical protein